MPSTQASELTSLYVSTRENEDPIECSGQLFFHRCEGVEADEEIGNER